MWRKTHFCMQGVPLRAEFQSQVLSAVQVAWVLTYMQRFEQVLEVVSHLHMDCEPQSTALV